MVIPTTSPLTPKQHALNGAPHNFAQNHKRGNTAFSRFLDDTPSSGHNAAHPHNFHHLEQLHDKIANLRGEILANALTGHTDNLPELDAHLTALNKTLKAEEARLNGKLIDIET